MESELLMKARKGNHNAFLALLKQYDRQVMSVICRFTGDLYDREDLYQDIFMHCFASLKKFRFEASFQTWLYRLAFNRCLDYIKKKKPVLEEIDRATVGIDWERREKLQAVQRAMSRLKGPQRICFHLLYVEEWTGPEIAQMMGCSEGAVKSHLDRARRKVRQDREVLLWQTNPS